MLVESMQQEYNSTVKQHCKMLFSSRILAMHVCKHVHYYTMLATLIIPVHVYLVHTQFHDVFVKQHLGKKGMTFSKSLDLSEPQLQ